MGGIKAEILVPGLPEIDLADVVPPGGDVLKLHRAVVFVLHRKFHGRFPGLKGTFGYRLFEVGRTFVLMSAIRVLDVYRDVPLTFKQVGTIFTSFNPSVLWNGSFLELGITEADWAVAAIGTLAMLVCSLLGRKEPMREQLVRRNPNVAWGGCVVLVLCMVIFGIYGIGFDATQFIYNQF